MKRQVHIFALVAVLGLVLAACAAPIVPASNNAATGDPVRVISVSGGGTAYGAPDIATAQIGAQTRNADPSAAVNENNTKMAAIIAALKALGVAEKDIQTTNFSVYAQQDYHPQTGESLESITYVVDNAVNITVRDRSKLGDVLTATVDAGANSIYGVSFSVADKTALEAQAREAAMNDARTRAEQLAKAAGVSVGEVMSISESVSGPQPIFYGREVAMAADGSSSVPVEGGEVSVQIQVSVTYSIQ